MKIYLIKRRGKANRPNNFWRENTLYFDSEYPQTFFTKKEAKHWIKSLGLLVYAEIVTAVIQEGK